jgi:hypothetical protein
MNDDGVTGATTSVDVLLNLPIEHVWTGITAIDRYGEWSPECIRGAWIEPNGRFEARNRFPDGFETYVTCTVTALVKLKRFSWDVHADEPTPLATWEYVLDP